MTLPPPPPGSTASTRCPSYEAYETHAPRPAPALDVEACLWTAYLPRWRRARRSVLLRRLEAVLDHATLADCEAWGIVVK